VDLDGCLWTLIAYAGLVEFLWKELYSLESAAHMSTTTSLSDMLPSSVPKLDALGKNWAVFNMHFKDAIDAKGYWGHFDGSSTRLIFATPAVVLTEADGTT